MEDNAMRALMIGVGVFVILLTITGVLSYISVAKDMATAANSGLNKWDDINIYNIMDYEGNVTINVTGMDLINFLREYVSQDNIRLKTDNVINSYEDMSTWRNGIGNVKEERLAKINPNAKLQMTKFEGSDDIIRIAVLGDIYILKNPVASVVYGDINGNGTLDSDDFNKLDVYLNNVLSTEVKQQSDVNGDGEVNNTDLTLLQEYIAGYGVALKENSGDINLDNVVNSSDAAALSQYLAIENSIHRESSDINLDRVIDEQDLNELRELLIERGIEVPIE